MSERGHREGMHGSNVSSLESTMPPTSSRELLAADGATILVFSHDAGLATVIKNVAGNRFPIRVIDQWRDLLQLVGNGSGRIVLVDVDALNQSVDESLADLNRSTDWLVTIIAAKQQQAQDFMRFWSERRIHRLLIKPAAVGITRLLLESAIARFMELRELNENTDALEIPPGLLEAAEAEGGRGWKRPALIGAAVVLAVGAAGYAMFSDGKGEAERPAVTAAARPSAADVATVDTDDLPAPAIFDGRADAAAQAPPQDPFADRIARAQAAEQAGRVVAPRNDNALDEYVAVLELAPAHPVARERLDALIENLFMQAEAALLAGDLATAETMIGHLRRGAPTGSRLHFLSEQLAQTREREAALAEARRAAEAATPAAEAVRTAALPGVEAAIPAAVPVEPTRVEPAAIDPREEVESMLTLAKQRLSEGALIVPAGDSARDYLQRAAEIDAGDARVEPLQGALADAAAAAAPAAFAVGDFDRAAELLEMALALGPATVTIETLRADVAAARAASAARAVSELHAQATMDIERMRAGGPAAPALDSFTRMRELDAGHGLTREVGSLLREALVTDAQRSIDTARFERARELVAALDHTGLDRRASARLQQAVAHGERQAAFLDETSPIGVLEVRRAEAPAYPRDALAGGVTGWVDLNFTVDEQGITRDIVVVDANPPSRFDDAAVDAVRRYEFEPFVLEGERYARRIRARVRFQLN